MNRTTNRLDADFVRKFEKIWTVFPKNSKKKQKVRPNVPIL